MRPFLIAFVLVAGLVGCRKEVIVTTEPYKPPYRISGLANLKYALNPFEPRPFNFYEKEIRIIYERGPQKLVGLEITGAPAGMVVYLSAVSGYPTYDTKLTLRDTGMVAGTYVLKAILKVAEEPAQEFPFTITTTGDASCINFFTRKFNADRLCDSAGSYPVQIVRIGTREDTVLIRNFRNDGTDLKAAISCFPGRLRIPRQAIGDTVYWGNGNIDLNPYYTPEAPFIELELNEEAPSGSYKECRYRLFFLENPF